MGRTTLEAAIREIACRWCGAAPGELCRVGAAVTACPHSSRLLDYRRAHPRGGAHGGGRPRATGERVATIALPVRVPLELWEAFGERWGGGKGERVRELLRGDVAGRR